ncbi:hypothetical protein P3W33_00950 [Luteibacter sp. PPL552]
MNLPALSLRRRHVEHVVLGLIAIGALLLRLYFGHTAVVIQPIRGDAVQYYSYAWNLVHHGVFSGAFPESTSVVADSFRDPGYPAFLATVLAASSSPEAFIRHVTDIQCVLSAMTVWIYAMLARRWIGFPAAISVALLLTIWPHTITLSDYVLSETLLGFLIAVALLFTDQALRLGGTWRPLAAGASFALASLTNAVVAPFAPMLAALMLWRHRRSPRLWALFLMAALLPVAAWSLRSGLLPSDQSSSGDRAKINLVQGSWPEYHAAYLFSHENADAAAVMRAIDSEYDLLRTDTHAGLERIGKRLGMEPARYAMWYLSKPMELWGWDIGIGSGDFYVYPTYRSPLMMQPVLAGIIGLVFFLSPFVLLFAAAGALVALAPASRTAPGLKIATALALWVTLVYGVLQSDARYSTPFRGLEIILAVLAAHYLGLALRRWATPVHGRKTS